MNSIALRVLAAHHQPREKDLLEFGKRLMSEHLIVSVSESIDIIKSYIFKNMSDIIDEDLPSIDLFSNPVLIMNILDEAVISMTYYIFTAHRSKDSDLLGYYRTMIDDFLPSVKKAVDNTKSRDGVLVYLYNYLCDLSHASMPCVYDVNEEMCTSKMSNDYYLLMYFYCASVFPCNVYFKELRNFYASRIIRM